MPHLATRIRTTGMRFALPEEPMIVAYMTRLSNIVISEDAHFKYDTAIVLNTAYFTWAGTENDPLVCVSEGWYHFEVNTTTLGTGYGGPNNADIVAAVTRNGFALGDYIVFTRSRAGSDAGASAHGFQMQDIAYLQAGDEIHVIYQNPGGVGVLVESNPSDGLPSGYLTDTGPGTLSPHLVIETRLGPAI